MIAQENWKPISYLNVKPIYEISSHGNFRNTSINRPRKLHNIIIMN